VVSDRGRTIVIFSKKGESDLTSTASAQCNRLIVVINVCSRG
jgi:hypothetical protein